MQVASDPWRAAASFAAVPKTKRLALQRSGQRGLTAKGKVVYTFSPLKRTVEQFGSPSVSVTAKSASNWPHLVAVLNAGATVLSEGATVTPNGRASWTVKFSLISDANLLKKGTRLRLTLGATSTVQNVANLLYLKPVPEEARLKISSVRLSLPVLAKPISR